MASTTHIDANGNILAGPINTRPDGFDMDRRPDGSTTHIDADGNIHAGRPINTQPLGFDMERGVGQDRFDAARASADRVLASPAELQQQRSVCHPGHWFPNFRWRSVLGVIIALQLVLYMVSCWAFEPRDWKAIFLFQPSPKGNGLFKLGSSNSVMERCAFEVGGSFVWELRRLVVPLFLHVAIWHLLLNLYFEFKSGQEALMRYGTSRFLCLFVVSGMGGNLLSGAFGVNGVGASTACLGLIGADVVRVWLMWDTVDEEYRKRLKTWLLVLGGTSLLWEIMLWDKIDHFGHLGGFVSGFCMALLLATEPPLLSNMRMVKLVAGIVLLVFFAASILQIFIFAGKPHGVHGGSLEEYSWTQICVATRRYAWSKAAM